MREKLTYFLRSLRSQRQTKRCPNCGGTSCSLIDQKYLVTKLLKCDRCELKFRFPTDSRAFLNDFYQSAYRPMWEETKSITDLPSESELPRLMKENFPDHHNRAPLVAALLKHQSARVLDYGCSWGYSVFQLVRAGFRAEGFEISRPRAELGKKIGVTIHSSEASVGDGLDLVISSHVIEHLAVISDFVGFASSRLVQGGIFVALCPNGSEEFRTREPETFHVNWGFLHSNYLDIPFAARLFSRNPYLILTGDWRYDLEELASWDGRSQRIGERRDGKELLIVAKPNLTVTNG